MGTYFSRTRQEMLLMIIINSPAFAPFRVIRGR